MSGFIVSDIEYIANEILLMKEGKIHISGTSEQIIASMPEQVWCLEVPRSEMDSYLRKYEVSK